MTATTAKELAEGSYPKRDDEALQEADMVMKGGITSGVVYPLAVCKLALTYRLRNVGGSSAGGIAAAFAAAAETNRDGGGFNVFARLPEQIGPVLADIFQPSKATRALHGVLLASLRSKGKGPIAKAAAFVRAIVPNAKVGFFAGTFVMALPLFWAVLLASGTPRRWDPDWWNVLTRGMPIPIAVSVLVGGTAGVVLQTVVRGIRGLTVNGYGLCRGSSGHAWDPSGPSGNGPEPFTDWMHARLNDVAGIRRTDVLTLGHLWGEEAVQVFRDCKGGWGDQLRAAESCARVRLEMMTTNVTHCRPERLPFESKRYLACLHELAAYFPTVVVDHLTCSEPAEYKGEPVLCPHHDTPLRYLPAPPDFPVIMTVRMTLSFPGLISAIPLYAVDYSARKPQPVRCWFSDGGVSSNFPIHFFDTLWPRRPTFGLNLTPYHPDYPDDDVYLHPPATAVQPRLRPTESLPGFVAALLDTLQNWSDEGMVRLPGYRERVVDVHQHEHEGGMNLLMSEDTIRSLSERGYEAALALLNDFDFPLHCWTRYLLAMSALDDTVRRLADRWGPDGAVPPGIATDGYRAFVAEYAGVTKHYRPSSAAWSASAVARTELLLAFDSEKRPPFFEQSPLPRPDLRPTPHF